jgi:hypothetical protein
VPSQKLPLLTIFLSAKESNAVFGLELFVIIYTSIIKNIILGSRCISASECVRVKLVAVPSVRMLAEAKKVALRRGTWFRVLNRIERGVLDLTVKFVDRIRSAKLVKVVTAIMEKLAQAMESAVKKMVRITGSALARKISGIAFGWGNRSALAWAWDVGFARYLVIVSLNDSPFQGSGKID